MKKITFLIVFSIFVFSACKKSTSTLNSVTTASGSIDSLSYQPSVNGSKWIYDSYVNNIKIGGKTTTVQNYDTIFNGKTYDVLLNADNTLEYFRNDSNKYKYYSVITASTNKTELCYLDISKNINETWVGGINGSDTYYYTIIEKTPSVTQNGISLKNVIKVFNEQKDASGNLQSSGYTWFAQGVGSTHVILNSGTNSLEIILTSADIK